MKIELSHMKVLREIQAICKERRKGRGCEGCKSCQFSSKGIFCLFFISPKYWELDRFEVEE